MENYYTNQFTDKSKYGHTKVKLGHISRFPNFIQFIEDKVIALTYQTLNKEGLTVKNLKTIVFKRLPSLQKSNLNYVGAFLLHIDSLQGIVYFNGTVFLFKSKIKRIKNIIPGIKEKPVVFKLNKVYYLLWLKNSAQILVLNFQNNSIEQTIILKKNVVYLQMDRISGHPKKPNNNSDLNNIQQGSLSNLADNRNLFYLALRDSKFINIYELDLESYPYLKQIQSFEVKFTDGIVLRSYVNHQYICCLRQSFGKSFLQIINRQNLEEIKINIKTKEKFVFLNEKFLTNKPPIILKIEEESGQHSLLVDIKKNQFSDEMFLKLNNSLRPKQNKEINSELQEQKKNLSLYTAEFPGKCMLMLMRKKENEAGDIWRLSKFKYQNQIQ
eukprot:403362391